MNNLSTLLNQIAVCQNCHTFKEHWRFPPEVHGRCISGVMVIGESSHKPSIDAGKYYVDGSLRSILDRDLDLERECYLTDLVKCDKAYLFPGSDLEEVAICCFKYLAEEIKFVRPKVIIAVGELAFRFLTQVKDLFYERQGDGKLYRYEDIPVIPITHPSHHDIHYGKASWQKQVSYDDSVRNIFLQALNI